MEYLQVTSWSVAAQPQPGVSLRTPDSLFRHNGFTIAPCERVAETPWYVIRMPGVLWEGWGREAPPYPDWAPYCWLTIDEYSGMMYYHTRESAMAKSKIAITLDDGIVGRIDNLVRKREYPNRSRAIEEAVREKLDRLERSQLAREVSKLDPDFERSLAEEGRTAEVPGRQEARGDRWNLGTHGGAHDHEAGQGHPSQDHPHLH